MRVSVTRSGGPRRPTIQAPRASRSGTLRTRPSYGRLLARIARPRPRTTAWRARGRRTIRPSAPTSEGAAQHGDQPAPVGLAPDGRQVMHDAEQPARQRPAAGHPAREHQVSAPQARPALSQTPAIGYPSATWPIAIANPCAGGYFDM